MAQTTVFEDNFNRGTTTTVTDGGTPSMTYTTTIGTGSGQAAYINANYLYLKNSTVAGNIYVSGETSKFNSIFNNVLSSNAGTVEWTFNTRYQQTALATGLAHGNWGFAVVLAGTNAAFHNAGNGYAIVYGSALDPDPIRLVRYTGGLQGTLTDVINTSLVINNINSLNDMASVRVKYIPSTNSWSLYVRDDNSAWVNVLTTPVPDTNQYGTTVVDNTYTTTGNTMTNFGFFWCHGTTGTSSSARFDNFKVTVDVPNYNTPLDSLDYHIYRGGLRNSATKFVNQKTGRVAFLGGSITYNPGWRDSISAYIRNKFPNTTFEFINAGIGSMGSTSAAFRLERDVLSKGKIDLLFEEAAVNDGPDGNDVPKAEQIRAMEGIVRHSLTSNPEMDIVFMYFADPSKNTRYASNLVPDVIINHDSVAKAYNIPAINLAKEVAYRILNQEFTWESGFGSVHPNRHGQGVYSRSMKCFLDSVWKTPVQSTDTIVKKTLPINKIDLNCYDSGYLVDVSKAEPSNDWILNPNWFPTDGMNTSADYTNVPMLIGQTPDAVLTFNFNGTAVGISPACGPNAGIIMSSIDNGPWMSTNLYTKWSSGLYLGRYITLYSTLSEGDHTLRLKMAEPSIATRNSAIIRHFYVSGTKIIASSISPVQSDKPENLIAVFKHSNGEYIINSNTDKFFSYTVYDSFGRECAKKTNCLKSDNFRINGKGLYVIKTIIDQIQFVNKIIL
jgi:sialidase-1